MPNENYIYRVLPTQMVLFWEAIKFACKEADEVKEEDLPKYFNELLHALLSDKAQCFVVLNSEKILEGLALTRLIYDKVTGKKELLLQCVYYMKHIEQDELMRNLQILIDFAKVEECLVVTFTSRNSRVWEMAKHSGCAEKHRTFIYKIGG